MTDGSGGRKPALPDAAAEPPKGNLQSYQADTKVYSWMLGLPASLPTGLWEGGIAYTLPECTEESSQAPRLSMGLRGHQE